MPTASKFLKKKIQVLPHKPGVYQFFDKNEKIIYVGKAKNLKKRVSSYFNKNQENFKTHILVKKIADIKHIVVQTESDALLLENNLIKKYQPRYNVMLKDDKSYPWIVVKNEVFPRVFSTRHLIKDGSVYYGPYTSVSMVRTILGLIRQLYPLRTCKYRLDPENITAEKYKVCLEYHIGNCLGPCEGKQTEADYNQAISEIHHILKGNIHSVLSFIKKSMHKASQELNFEKAQKFKQKIDILENYQSKSTIVNPKINNVDVFSINEDDKFGFVNYLKLVNGAIIQVHTVEMKKKLQENKKDLLQYAITDIRQRLNSDSKEIIVPFPIDFPFENIKITVPKRGDKKKLLELSERNVKYYKLEKAKQAERIKKKHSSLRIMETIQKDLHLDNLPKHIECFDNSNLQGTNPVASCVVFKEAKPSPKDYRHFHIKSVKGIDDFASMKEVVFRRYKRLQDEKQELPQLVVIDGGKGQLTAAVSALETLQLLESIKVISIAKRLEEIYFPGDPVPLYLDKNSETLKIIQHIRNESHRFGIKFHRNLRSKSFLKSQLVNINGIGDKTAENLLKHFGSVKVLSSKSQEEIAKLIGDKKANIVYKHFHK